MLGGQAPGMGPLPGHFHPLPWAGQGGASVPPPSPHGPCTLLPRPVPWHWVAPEWPQPLLLFAGKSSVEVAGPPVGLPDWAARWPLPQTPPPSAATLSAPVLSPFVFGKNVL